VVLGAISGYEAGDVFDVIAGGYQAVFYVPAGADIPDPKVNPAFAFKLDFLDAMECWAKEQKKG